MGPCSPAQWIDSIFLLLFTAEMLVKMTAMGLFRTRKAYFSTGWNWLDFIVVVAGFLDEFTSDFPAVTVLRLAKTFRPLRSIQRVRGMRVLVQCMLEALPQLCNVLVFLCFFLILFGLFGVSFFHGAMRHTCWAPEEGANGSYTWANTGVTCDAECSWHDEGYALKGRCGSLGNGTRGLESFAAEGRWSWSCEPGQQCRCAGSGYWNYDDYERSAACSYTDNPNYGINSFDSLPWAMVTLFQAITLEGWVDIMYQLMDGVSVFAVLYMVPLVLFGGLIIINLFLAVLVQEFNMADRGAYEDPDITLDDDLEAAGDSGEIATAKEMSKLAHTNPLRRACVSVMRWRWFDITVQLCILINTLIMMLRWVPAPYDARRVSIPVHDARWDYLTEGHFLFLMTMNIVLTTIFAIESAIKVIGLGPRLFTRDRLNVFDLVVVIFSLIELILDYQKRFHGAWFTFPVPLSVLRTFRIFRLFKLAKSVESLRKVRPMHSLSVSALPGPSHDLHSYLRASPPPRSSPPSLSRSTR